MRKENSNKKDKWKFKKKHILCLLGIAMILIGVFGIKKTGETKHVPYSEFLKDIDAGQIDEINIKGNTLEVSLIEGEEYLVESVPDDEFVSRLVEKDIKFEKSGTDLSKVIGTIINWGINLLLIALIYFSFRKTMKTVDSSYEEEILNGEMPVKFNDVAGEDEAKESLTDIVDFLHNPEKYKAIGAKLPKGALLIGPPGTGKTLLAKAVAGEAGVPFYSISGSDFVELYVGLGSRRVRSLFSKAKKNAPCIIFIDEIDAIGRARGVSNTNDERESTLNSLLTEMDGFSSDLGVIVLAATNRPDVLDKALLRPGRFDRKVLVDAPNKNGRKDIFNVHLSNVKVEDGIDLDEISMMTSGVSGAMIANIVNEAAILAAKDNREKVSKKDIENAIEIIQVGKIKKNADVSNKERRMVAFHEIGHAIAAASLKNTEPIQKITIIPRTEGALGFVMQSQEEERYLMTKEELEDKIVTLLAGRSAENIFFNTSSTGASNDIEQATKIAKEMVIKYGMSENIGLISYSFNKETDVYGGVECSGKKYGEIDTEISNIINAAYAKAKNILIQNRDKIEELVEVLLDKETLTGSEFMEIFNRV